MSNGRVKRSLPRTANGRARRQAIIDAAAALMYERGAGATSIDEVLVASGSGKSQLYHYFDDRRDLLRAVVGRQADAVMANQSLLTSVQTFDDLGAWADQVSAFHRTEAGPLPCPVGSLAAELRNDPELRSAAADAFERWIEPLTDAVARVQHAGEIDSSETPRALAIRVLAALQGAMLLASTLGDADLVGDVLQAQLAAVR